TPSRAPSPRPSSTAGVRHCLTPPLSHAVVDDQPAVPGQDRRSPAADLEPLPRRNRSRQSVMRSKPAKASGCTAIQGHLTVGNPDAFPVEVQSTGCGVERGFFRTSAGKERPMEDGEFGSSGWIRDGNRKETGIFVVHVAELEAVIRREGRDPQTLPVEEVLRYGQGDPWALGGKRRVRHHIAPERLHERDPSILAATAAVGTLLKIGCRLQCDAEPLDA